MKYRFLVLLAAVLFPVLASAQDEPTKATLELDAGLSVGDLAARGEYSLNDGLFSVGARFGARFGSLSGYDFTHFIALGDLRWYPTKNMEGFFPYIGAGIDTLAGRASGNGTDFAATRAPIVGGLGYKLVFDQFSAQLFLGGGTLLDISVPSGGVPVSLNSILDFLLDGGVFVGYRF